MRQRLLLSLLLAGALLTFAVGRLPLADEGLARIFSLSWLTFALLVMSANIVGLLHMKKRFNVEAVSTKQQIRDVEKLRRYGR